MALAKRKSQAAPRDPIALDTGIPAPAPAAAPDLAGEILRLRGQVEAFIDAKVAELKASRDGADQPVEALRAMLTRNDSCHCRAAMNILANDQ